MGQESAYLSRGTTRSDRGQKVNGGVLALPVGLRVLSVLAEEGGDVALHNASNLRLEVGHERLGEVGGGLAAGVALS